MYNYLLLRQCEWHRFSTTNDHHLSVRFEGGRTSNILRNGLSIPPENSPPREVPYRHRQSLGRPWPPYGYTEVRLSPHRSWSHQVCTRGEPDGEGGKVWSISSYLVLIEFVKNWGILKNKNFTLYPTRGTECGRSSLTPSV